MTLLKFTALKIGFLGVIFMGRIEKRKEKEKAKRKKIIKRTLLLTLITLVVFISGAIYYYINLYNKNSYIADSPPKTDISDETLPIKEEPAPAYTEVEGITNVLLIGLDARNPENSSRSDTIMILTIDSIHKKLKVTSIMRDTYVQLPKYDEQKINHSYFYGQAPLLMDTIEYNFNINLDDYAIIDFDGFKHLVDLVGGLDINVEEYMIDELNLCIKELGNTDSIYITEPGLQHLTGEQVLGYSRMRHLKGDGYARTERQREVVSLLLNKVSDTSVFKYPKIASEMLPFLKTNVNIPNALNLAYTVYKIDNYDVEKLQIPVNEISAGIIHPKKGWLLITDINQNAQILNDFIFEDITYDKSKVSYNDYKKYVSKYYNEINALKAAAEAKKTSTSKDKKTNNINNNEQNISNEVPDNNSDGNTNTENSDDSNPDVTID